MDYPIRTTRQLRSLLIAFRKAQKLGQASLAAKLGVTQQALSALERDPAVASFERLFNLLSKLHVDIVLRVREPQASKPSLKPEPLKSVGRGPSSDAARTKIASKRTTTAIASTEKQSGRRPTRLDTTAKHKGKPAKASQEKW